MTGEVSDGKSLEKSNKISTSAVGHRIVFRLTEQRNQVTQLRRKAQINMVLFSMNWLTQAEAAELKSDLARLTPARSVSGMGWKVSCGKGENSRAIFKPAISGSHGIKEKLRVSISFIYTIRLSPPCRNVHMQHEKPRQASFFFSFYEDGNGTTFIPF